MKHSYNELPGFSVFCTLILIALLSSGGALRAETEPDDETVVAGVTNPAVPNRFLLEQILFSGNDVTRPSIMLQEMMLVEGSVISREDVANAEQNVMDLGLFKSVESSLAPVGEGWALTITVKEKWYILPIPRLSLNGDGESSYGIRVRWNNVAGLNQKISLLAKRGTNAEDDRGDTTKFSIDYDYPLVMGTRWGFGTSLDISRTPTEEELRGSDELVNANEQSNRASISVSRKLDRGIKGWGVGLGLAYWHFELEPTDNDFTSVDLDTGSGKAFSVRASLGNNEVKDYGYSRGGWRFGGRAEHSIPGGGSEHFNFWKLTAGGARFIQIGKRSEHRRVVLRGGIAAFNGGPRNWMEYSIGGSSDNRGFKKSIEDGNFKFNASAEYLQPIFGTNSVRGLLLMDVSQIYDEVDKTNLDEPLVSIGIGIRWRIQSFVNTELDLILAYGIQDGSFRGTGGTNRGD